MSRQHLIIEHKPQTGFTLTVKSPNGVLVDHIMFMDGEHIPLVKGSLIEVLGTRLIFGGEKLQLQHDGDGEGQPMDMDTPLSPATTNTNATKSITEGTDGSLKKMTTTTTTAAAAAVAVSDTDLPVTMDTEPDTTNRLKLTTSPSDSLLPPPPSKPLDFLDTLIRLLGNDTGKGNRERHSTHCFLS
jgi:predicted component of type VI protein secretion system